MTKGVPPKEARILTRLNRIKLVLLKAAQGKKVRQRDARAALKDLVDIENLRNTPPPPETLGTLRGILDAEEDVVRMRRGPTLGEVALRVDRHRSTICRHRDALAAHGCLTRIYARVQTWGNWVTTKYARENIEHWEEIERKRIERELAQEASGN